MQPSLFQSYALANYIGLFLLIMGVVFFTKADDYTRILRSVKWTDFSMLITGCVSLLLGIFLIQHHNLWVMRPRVILTFLAWLIFLKALIAILYPQQMINLYFKIITRKKIIIFSVINVILGLVFIIDGAHLLHSVKF
jgi:hypothetical protein